MSSCIENIKKGVSIYIIIRKIGAATWGLINYQNAKDKDTIKFLGIFFPYGQNI